MSDTAAISNPSPPAERSQPRVYGRRFWCAYAANTCLMVAVSLLFRYSDFVHTLGGDELNLGIIIGVGMTGSLLVRLAQGIGIDRYGPRLVWLLSLLLFSGSCLAHLAVTNVDGVGVFAARILLNVSIAGCFGASISYITRSAPLPRMAEVVGTLGSSGFVGMITGPAIGDMIFGDGPVQPYHVQQMFIVAAGLAAVSFVLAWFATIGQLPPTRGRTLPITRVLRRYHPGAILAIGVAMGFGLGLPGVFLRPFTARLGITGMASFFAIYAVVAFAVRMTIRRLPEKIGNRPMVLCGVSFLSLGMLSFLLVGQQWQLAFPAVTIALAHAMLFPSVVAEASAAFPVRFRGLGTTLILAMFDVGALVGAPLVGGIVRVAALLDMPQYPTAFITVALLLASIGTFYALAGRHENARPARSRHAKLREEPTPKVTPHEEAGDNSDAEPVPVEA